MVAQNYKEAFLVYIFKSTTDFHFNYHGSLLPIPLNITFLIGLLLLLFNKKYRHPFSYLLVALILLFPITNQVIPKDVGFDHRLMSILPILYLVCAAGLIGVVSKIPKYQKIILSGVVIAILSSQLWFYFVKRPSDIGYQIKDYTLQYIIDHINHTRSNKSFYVLGTTTYDFYMLHYLETIEYFTHPKEVKVLKVQDFLMQLHEQQDSKVKTAIFIVPDQMLINSQGAKKTSYVRDCTKSFIPTYICPIGFVGTYGFYTLE